MTVEIGTASNAFDLFEKLRTFLTVTLPIAERWQELSYNPGYTLMVGVFASSGSITLANNPFNTAATSWSGTTNAQPWTIGIQFDQPVYLTAADITALTNNAQPAVINFQYSDDGINWNTQDSFSGMVALDWASSAGIKHFNLTGSSANKHKYWRLHIPDSTGTSTESITLHKIVLWQDSNPLNVQLRKRLSLKGPGGGSDEIFVNLETDYSVSGDWYNWRLYGATGFIAGNALDFSAQPGASLPVGLSLWQASIPYWFIANGRRFMVIAKINTTYHALYAGFILPYATPSQYPYPLMIGGSNAMGSLTDARLRWSSTNDDCRNFYDPGGISSDMTSLTSVATLYLRFADGSWYPFKNWYTSSSPEASAGNGRNVWPWGPDSAHATAYKNIVTAIDGSYVLFPCIMHVDGANPSPNILGEIHGVFAVTGFGNAAENTTTINGVTYLIIPNVFRTAKERWAAIALE
ncbi:MULTISPECIES: hypothetical protein [Nitrosomonas]|uniref:F5/8 type C domain-containing protein n=1 Tax=Nitrosomonas communis TaxID=44574 RepID=A0A5D3YCT8_9PROT|nr:MULTISPECIES: hypothetical protein [Nitrosomonas]TYP83876.1 hypothetical protein BCL69_10402 [Nitrosomonas communis]UVS62012.1 hypothetical protein NX761_02445 [Nitrosomonas sp. PLL12]